VPAIVRNSLQVAAIAAAATLLLQADVQSFGKRSERPCRASEKLVLFLQRADLVLVPTENVVFLHLWGCLGLA
jgi:hypothetical protein